MKDVGEKDQQGATKTWGMEEISPAMPGVMFLKYLRITGEVSDHQGKFEYAECVERKKALCSRVLPQNTPS